MPITVNQTSVPSDKGANPETVKVLIVEDEVILLKQLNSLIREALPEAKLLPFDNPGDALAALAKEELDIAFLDIAVGEMNLSLIHI